MDMVLRNGLEAAGLSRWQTEEIPFIFFFLLSEGEHVPSGSEDCLASRTGCIAERAGGRVAAGRSQLHYTENRRSTGSRSADKILRPSLGNVHPDREKCLKMFLSNTRFTVR